MWSIRKLRRKPKFHPKNKRFHDKLLMWDFAMYYFAKDELLQKARELAFRLAENGPLAIRKIKEGVLRSSGCTMEQALRIEDEVSAAVMASKDAREGPRAFKEKRKPRFSGE